MASYTVSRSKHATLTPSTLDSVIFSVEISQAEVHNRGTSAGDIYFTVDGSTPVVGADNTFVVPAGGALTVGTDVMTADTVKLISAVAQPYSVTRADGG